jgi:hypothetical protein
VEGTNDCNRPWATREIAEEEDVVDDDDDGGKTKEGEFQSRI